MAVRIGRCDVKKTYLTLLLVLFCVTAFSLVGCQDMDTVTTTLESDPTTSLALAPTTTVTAGPALGGLPTTVTMVSLKVTTTVSPALGALKEPAPTVELLQGTATWDIDRDIDGALVGADIHYVIADELVHYLEAQNGAGFTRLFGKPFSTITRADLLSLAYASTRLDTEGVDDPNVLDVGSVFAVRTDTGQYAKIEVTGYEPETMNDGSVLPRYSIRLRFVLYPR
jgi:hypothetical protein